MEQQKGQEIPNKQKNNNVECQVNVINKTVYKKCQEQNLRLQTDASKCFKCMEEGTKFCKHTVEYSKDTTLEVGNTKDEMLQDQPKVREEKQKEESTKSVLERPVSEEKPDEPNKSSHIDHDPVEIKGVKKFFGQKKKSQILQRKCIKRLLTSEKEEYMESVCQSSLRDEKSAAVISEDERQSRVWGEDERGVTPNSTADQNILESTSSSNSQENEYQPCHSTDMSSGSQSSGSKSKVHTVANEANRGHQDSITNVDNFTDVHSENDQLSKDTDKNYQSPKKQKGVEGNQSACPLHKKLQDPESSQAKTESKSKMVECIDLLSDDDGGDDASTAYTSTTASKTLHHVREKIVPTVCEKCRSIWNNQVLSTIFLGVESVTVNSKITYGAIICINHWAESHYLSGKESAVRSLLDRADLCKNIGSLRISEVNHWLGSLMKAGKVKCCDVFEAFYQPDVQNKLLSSLPHTDVSTDKATGIKIRVDSVDGENQPPKKNISQSPKDCPSSLKNQSLTSPGYILPLQKGSDSAKNVLSGVWNTPVFDRKVVLPGIGQEKSATCLDKQGKSTSGYAQECATRNCQIDSGKTTSTEAVYSSSDMGKAVSPKQSLQSSSEKAELVLTEVTPPATKAGSSSEMVSPVSRKRTADMLIEDTPHTLRDENSQNLESVDSKITTTATLCEKPTTDLEKDVASHSETNETPPSMSYNVLQTDDTVAEKILDTSVSSTSHSNSTVITSLTLPPDASTSDCLNESLHSVSVEQEIDTPKRKRKRKRKSLAPPTRSARPIIHPSQSPTSQDATVTSSAMSPQHSTLVATNLTLTSHNEEAGKTTVSSTQEAASSIEQWPTLQQEHDPPLQPLQLQAVFNKEEQCSQEQHDINSTSTLQNAQNSSKVYMHQIDENSIPSDSDSGGGEDNLHVNSEESSSDNLCSVLGLNVSTLDTYCSSTDMKTITNGVMARNPSKRYKFSFCHYAMLKEQSALSGLAREAFNLMPFESDNCRPLAQGTNGRERFLTNRELLTLQSICILHPENPDVDLFFRILVQILMTRSRVLLVPNSLTLLLVAENLRRECNRAKTKGTYSMFLSQDWDTSNVYTAKDLLHSKLEKVKEPTVRSVLSVFCLWKNLGKQVTNISLPEALEDLCKNIDLTTSDKTKLCIKLYARFCEYLYEEKNSSLAEFFLNQPFTGCNTPMARKVLINTMVTKLSLDITHLSSAGSLNIAEKEVQGALQKCLALEKAVLQSRNAQKEEEFRLNVVTFRDKLDRYKQVNDLLSKRMKIAEKEKQEVLTKIVDSKSRKLVRELGQTLTAIHQSLAKRKGVTGMDERENSRKALKVDYSTDIHSSVDICSRDRFSNTAASVDLGEDVSQTIREGIYELLASEVDVDQVRPVIYLIMNKVAGEEAPRLPSVSWIRNFARLNGFKIK
nr:uncharacterized protein LOC128704414 [Cherax quadricarinatus]